MSDVVKHIVVCKTKEDVEPAKKLAEDQGGKITNTYTIFPGFDVEFPKDSMHIFKDSEHVESVEVDREVKTQ